ncbi:hypothetical protein BDR26DRAFT_915012 [Obelidium mucronatum]|nr:hypothetical protein BDR26DRAFT_915012 [Obelidium mucronatum]
MKEMAKPKQEQHAVLVDPKFSTTLNTIPGYKIVKYLGHVRGSAQSYKAVMEACEEQLLASHYDLAIHSLLGHAGALGANAIISVRFDCSANSFAHGTAVVVVPV